MVFFTVEDTKKRDGKGGAVMGTMLTWCEECGEDMHQNGGRACKFCEREFCYICITEHEKHCIDNPNSEDDDE